MRNVLGLTLATALLGAASGVAATETTDPPLWSDEDPETLMSESPSTPTGDDWSIFDNVTGHSQPILSPRYGLEETDTAMAPDRRKLTVRGGRINRPAATAPYDIEAEVYD